MFTVQQAAHHILLMLIEGDSVQTQHYLSQWIETFDWSNQKAIHTYWQPDEWLACRHMLNSQRESALIALFHVRWRPLYCKQLRASLIGLSGWELEYFPLSPATACHKGTSVADNTEVATVFFVSLRVSHKLFSMQASFLSPPPHFLEALFFPLLCCSSQWPLLRGQRQTLRPAKGLSASMVSFALEQKRTDAAHTQQTPPNKSTTDSHILPKLPLSLLSPISFFF